MTAANMVIFARTLLDETGITSGFWTDTEIYSALASGQQAVANYFLGIYKMQKQQDHAIAIPQPLEPLYFNEVNTTTTGLVAKPADYWHLLGASFAYTGGLVGTFYKCRIYHLSEVMFDDINNSFLAATNTDPIVYEVYSSGQKFYFLPTVSGTGAYSLNYLKVPSAIASGTEPTLPVQTHNAIVFYAVAQMMFKQERTDLAQVKMQEYFTELQGIK